RGGPSPARREAEGPSPAHRVRPRAPDPAPGVRPGTHPARGRRAPERHGALRPRSADVGARRPLQGARRRQSLRRRRELLPLELGGEPGTDDHRQRPPRRRSSPRASGVRRPALLLACTLLAAGAWAAEPRIRAVDAVGMTVADADRSVDFYTRVLGFT